MLLKLFLSPFLFLSPSLLWNVREDFGAVIHFGALSGGGIEDLTLTSNDAKPTKQGSVLSLKLKKKLFEPGPLVFSKSSTGKQYLKLLRASNRVGNNLKTVLLSFKKKIGQDLQSGLFPSKYWFCSARDSWSIILQFQRVS